MADGTTFELLACLYCQARLPTSITSEQFINHIQVKHNIRAGDEVRRALVHLRQIKEKNPRLKKSTAPVLPKLPPCPTKRNIHLQTVVDGGCSSIGAKTPRLLEVEDEIRPKREEEVEMKANQKVAENKEELSANDNATQLVDNSGKADKASRESGLEGGGAVEEDTSCGQVKIKQDRVTSCKVSTCAKVECPVLRSDKVIYTVAPMQDKDGGEEFDAMEVEKADVDAEKPKKLANGLNEAMEDVEGKDDTDASGIESLENSLASGIESLENSLKVKNTERVENNLHAGSTVDAEKIVGDALEDVNCTKNRVKSIECAGKGCGKMFHSKRDMEDHMRGMHGAERLSCPTPGCEVNFVSYCGLQCHIKNYHLKDRTIVGKLKNKKKNLKTRKLTVNQLMKTGTLKQYKRKANKECLVEGCLKRFYTECLREDHMRMDHGQSQLICQMCEASYFSREGLNRHVKKVHMGKDDITKHKLGDQRDNATSNVGKVRDMFPIAVKVQEPEVEVLDMEIF